MKKAAFLWLSAFVIFSAGPCLALTTSLSNGGESIAIEWPDQEGWKVGYEQDNGSQAILETVISPETVENWTQIGTVLVTRGDVESTANFDLDVLVDALVKRAQTNARDVQIEKEKEGLPGIEASRIFVIKAKDYPDGTSETQVQLLVKGKKSVFNIQRTKRTADLDQETIRAWVAFLKTARLTAQEDKV